MTMRHGDFEGEVIEEEEADANEINIWGWAARNGRSRRESGHREMINAGISLAVSISSF